MVIGKKSTGACKGLHVEPGKQPEMISAIWHLKQREVFGNARFGHGSESSSNSWRMDMMSPKRQRVSPYFLGGPTIIVSFPTNTMSHEEKVDEFASNNIHFSRANGSA